MGTRFYYKQKKGISDPVIEKLAARFGTNRITVKCLMHLLILFIFIPERSLVISDETTSAYIESPVEAEASDREVSPKLIVGTKKYGRRSRPHNDIGLNELSVTDSDNTDEDRQQSLSGGSEQITQVSSEKKICCLLFTYITFDNAQSGATIIITERSTRHPTSALCPLQRQQTEALRFFASSQEPAI